MKRDYQAALGHSPGPRSGHHADGYLGPSGPVGYSPPGIGYPPYNHHPLHHPHPAYNNNNNNNNNSSSNNNNSNYHAHNNHHGSNNASYGNHSIAGPNKGPAKQLMSFHSYVRQLSNSVDENTACKKYKDFMANLSQSKVGRFFEANKDREWFRVKYHPVEGQKTLMQQYANLHKRLQFFNRLNDANYFDKISLDYRYASKILNLMDAVIVFLEDGPQYFVDQLLSDEETAIDNQLRQTFVPSKPNSVVIYDVSIETTLSEIEDLCTKAHPDLVRIVQLDPYYVEGGFLRRKFVAIYKSDADIKDVCWKLSRTKLNNKVLTVSINKCLTNRIISVSPLSNNHVCIVRDIRNAITLILNFDELRCLHGKRKQLLDGFLLQANMVNVKAEASSMNDSGDANDSLVPMSPIGSDKSAIGEDEEEKPFDVSMLDEDRERERKKLYEFKFNIDSSPRRLASKLSKSKNPLLDDAHLYLVEFFESSAAHYYTSKIPTSVLGEGDKIDIEKNLNDKFLTLQLIVKNLPCSVEESARYLDKLLWYLRIVHSFDYYKKTVYRHEDELTLRMSVVHLRDEPAELVSDVDESAIRDYLDKSQREFTDFGLSQTQRFVTKDEERFDYRSYGKVITDELTSYAQRIQKPKSNDTEEVYKCKHCTRVFQKLSDIGRHFVGKHRWAVDVIELETDFFNTYLFDVNKISPEPPKELIDIPPNRFAKMTNLSQMGEDPDLLQKTIDAYKQMESFVREPAPRVQVESDPRNETIVDYNDISFDDAI